MSGAGCIWMNEPMCSIVMDAISFPDKTSNLHFTKQQFSTIDSLIIFTKGMPEDVTMRARDRIKERKSNNIK